MVLSCVRYHSEGVWLVVGLSIVIDSRTQLINCSFPANRLMCSLLGAILDAAKRDIMQMINHAINEL